MDVFLDGKLIDASASAKSVEELLGGALPAGEDRIIIGAQLDGQPLGDDDLAALLGRPLSLPGRLELSTESTRLLAASVLGQAAAALEETRAHHVPIAEHLAAGRQAEGMELLGKSLTAWEAADKALRQAGQLAGMNVSAAAPGGEIAACHDILSRIQRALQAGDMVNVADLVEHELPPLTDRWSAMLVRLQQSLLA